MSTPNFFSDAPESLQDAFIRWLVECATESTNPLYECGLAFVRALFRAGVSNGTKDIPVLGHNGNPMTHKGPCKVSDVCTPIRQYQKIDVYFQAKVDGKRVSFIIEDKIDSQPGKDQLKNYRDSVVKDKEKKDLIKPVYFKTGYVFSEERDSVEQDKYSVFKAEDLKKFLDCHPDAIRENQILCQYSEYLNNKIHTRTEALKNWDLNQDYVQWKFMPKLRNVLIAAVDNWKHFRPKALSNFQHEWKKSLKRDKNTKGGSPYIQYWFSTHLEWRLDAWRPLKLKIYRNNPGGSKEESDAIVYEYRKHFKKVLQQAGLSGNVRGRVKKVQECAIGSIDTANLQGMIISEFLDRVRRVHIEFLKSVS